MLPVSTRTTSFKPPTGSLPRAVSVDGKIPLLIVLDGVALDMEDTDRLQDVLEHSGTDDVENIEVLRTPGNTAIYGGLGAFGVLLINSRQGGSRAVTSHNITNISTKGFTTGREFYTPRYDQLQTSDLPDLRSTIYWNPAVKTSTEGKAKFEFFNADDKGTYKVVIEGINAAGELARQVYRYKVE